MAREKIAWLEQELQEREDQLAELHEIRQQSELELRLENESLSVQHQSKLAEMQQQIQKLNLRNQQLYSQQSENRRSMEDQLHQLRETKSNEHHDRMTKLADFTIFLMKLIQRLEGQTHQNLLLIDEPSLKEHVRSAKYVQARNAHATFKLPEGPDELVSQLLASESAAKQLLDDKLMPAILSMAKYHVDAVNSMHRLCLQEKDSKAQATESLGRQLEDLRKEHDVEVSKVRDHMRAEMASLKEEI